MREGLREYVFYTLEFTFETMQRFQAPFVPMLSQKTMERKTRKISTVVQSVRRLTMAVNILSIVI